MMDTRKLVAGSLSGITVVAICLIWALSGNETEVLDKQIAAGDKVTAGALLHGSRIEQEFEFSLDSLPETVFLGIQFATYGRKNPGLFTIDLLQDGNHQTHSINTAELVDNKIVYFPFISIQQGKATLSIESEGSTKTRSATVWCHYSPGAAPMLLNGEPSERRVDLWIAKKESNQVYVINRIGWVGLIFISVVVSGVLSLLFYFGWIALASGKWAGAEPPETRLDPNAVSPFKTVLISLLAGSTVSVIIFFSTQPLVVYKSINDTFSTKLVHASPIIEGVEVAQEIEITPDMAVGRLGLGLRFGTFMRKNSAKLSLSLEQGEHFQKQVFSSKTLEDNVEKRFVFSGFQPGPAKLKLTGLSGTGSRSPTVWLEPNPKVPHVTISGEAYPQRLVVYRYFVIDQEQQLNRVGRPLPIRWFLTISTIVFFLLHLPVPWKRSI